MHPRSAAAAPASDTGAPPLVNPRVSLAELFWTFFRIACTSFGGFMAMISVVQQVVVERKKLLSHADALDGISLASILPGPVAVNFVAYVGYRLRGGSGAWVSALAAVLPSFTVILLLSIAYFTWGNVPTVGKIFMGFLPAVTAIIVVAAWNMARKAVTGAREFVLAVAAGITILGIGGFFSTLGIIVAAGALGLWWFRGPATPAQNAPAPPRRPGGTLPIALLAMPTNIAPLLLFEPSILLKLFLTFGSMSLMLFGGAYVFIPLIQETVVEGQGWVTQKEFIDAVAMGQITPGPILVSAAFIGLKVAGLAGAIAATLGIYLPSAILMVLCTHLLQRIRGSRYVTAALRGIRPAVVGMIFAAAAVVGGTAALVWASGAIFAAALFAQLRYKLDAVWIVPAAGLLGVLLY